MPKSDNPDTTDKKSVYICSECKNEFKGGKECPQCGNQKDNMKLAPDGIEQNLHKNRTLFGSVSQLQSSDNIFNDERMMEIGRAKMQVDEMNDNLRQAYVFKSEITKKEKEMELIKKQQELNNLTERVKQPSFPSQPQNQNPNNSYPNQYNQYSQQDYSGMGMGGMGMGAMSPQSLFLSKFLKMDKNERQSFMESLENAEPETLQKLSSMFYTPQQIGGGMGMGGMGMGNPYMYSVPPWMMMQQPQQQPQHQSQNDSIALVSAVFDLVQKLQPQRDDSAKEAIRELKDEIKRMQDQIQRGTAQGGDIKPIIDKMNNLEIQIQNSNQNKKTISDSIAEISQLVTGLSDMGIVKRPGSEGKTVDDELRIKEFEFKKEMTLRDKELESQKYEVEKNKQEISQKLVSTLFNRGIQKAMISRQEQHPQSKSSSTSTITIPTRIIKPQEIVDQIQSDAGVIKETRPSIKRSGE